MCNATDHHINTNARDRLNETIYTESKYGECFITILHRSGNQTFNDVIGNRDERKELRMTIEMLHHTT